MHIRGVEISLSSRHLFMSDTPVCIHSLNFFKTLGYSLGEILIIKPSKPILSNFI
jgi:hypothetical protein